MSAVTRGRERICTLTGLSTLGAAMASEHNLSLLNTWKFRALWSFCSSRGASTWGWEHPTLTPQQPSPTHTSHTYWGAQWTQSFWGGSFPASAPGLLCKHTRMLWRKEGGKTTSNEMPYYGNAYGLRASLCLCCISEIKIKAFVALQRFLHT